MLQFFHKDTTFEQYFYPHKFTFSEKLYLCTVKHLVRNIKLRAIAAFSFAIAATAAVADDSIAVNASLTAGIAGGDFVPFYQGSLAAGRFVSSRNLQLEASAVSPLNLNNRFSWAAAVDLIFDCASAVNYARFDGSEWTTSSVHPSRARIQQLFASAKWRGVFIDVGMKEFTPVIGHKQLSSGDLIVSNNARPVPGVRAGFVDFQNIPFTNGWAQILGEVFYGKMTDGNWWSDFANHYNYHYSGGQWYNYKSVYFRSNPGKPLSVMIGAQAAATFGGWTRYFSNGSESRYSTRKVTPSTIFKMIIPTKSKAEDFVDGNHIGSWNLEARYRLGNGDNIKARFSWPWEDGSGMGKLNGWDGLWGIEFSRATSGNIIDAAVVEYIDMTNQSGPIHFAPSDRPGTDITAQATGADDYYNNGYYNSYAYYGLSIGSPMLMAPAFNIDGFGAYVANRLRGIHVGAQGFFAPRVSWTLKAGYRKAWGNAKIMLLKPMHLSAAMVEVAYRAPWVNGLNVAASLEFNSGNMPASTFGAMVKFSYSTDFRIKKNEK